MLFSSHRDMNTIVQYVFFLFLLFLIFSFAQKGKKYKEDDEMSRWDFYNVTWEMFTV